MKTLLKLSVLACLAVLMASTAAGMVAVKPPITVSAGDSFKTNYNGYGGDPVQDIDGLTASAVFYGFTFAYNSTKNWTQVNFSFDLTNTSSDPITASRVSGLSFITSPTIKHGAPNSVSGVFNKVTLDGNVPMVGQVEFCFSQVNCAGGGSGGVDMGDTETGNAKLFFTGNISSLTFDEMAVRYQGIASTDGLKDFSASGSAVPEPSAYVALIVGLGAVGYQIRRRRAEAAAAAAAATEHRAD